MKYVVAPQSYITSIASFRKRLYNVATSAGQTIAAAQVNRGIGNCCMYRRGMSQYLRLDATMFLSEGHPDLSLLLRPSLFPLIRPKSGCSYRRNRQDHHYISKLPSKAATNASSRHPHDGVDAMVPLSMASMQGSAWDRGDYCKAGGSCSPLEGAGSRCEEIHAFNSSRFQKATCPV